jgi:hypothetical protein
VKLAIGLCLSPNYAPPAEFWMGAPESPSAEGAVALVQRLASGRANAVLADKLTGYRIVTSRQFPTDVARNEICKSVLDGDEDYLLFLDCDMTHPADLFERLVAHQKPVITARYHGKKDPWNPILYVKHRVLDGPHAYTPVHFGRGVFEIERCGAGALLIRRDVLDAIYRAHGHNWFRYQRKPEPPYDYGVSEDFWFCKVARELGYSVWADWDTVCGHIGFHCERGQAFDVSLNRQTEAAMAAGGDTWETFAAHAVVAGAPKMVFPNGEEIGAYIITEGER